MATKKNILKESTIKSKGKVRIGDDITTINNYHHAAPETKLPKELCAKIPYMHTDDIIGREEELQDLRCGQIPAE